MADQLPGDGSAPRSNQGPVVFVVTHGITARFLMLDQLLFLAESGFDVRVLAAGGPDLEAVEDSGITTTAVPLQREIRPIADLFSLFALLKELRRIRPRVVNAGTPKAGLLAMIAAWLLRVPHRIYTLRGLRLETATGLKRTVLALTERIAAGCADQVICVSTSLMKRAEDLGLVAPGKAGVLADGSSKGVDLERYRPRRDDDPELQGLRRELGLEATTPVIGFVGRFVRDKGIEDLLAAFFENVLPAHPRARLLLVGDFEQGDPPSSRARRIISEGHEILRPGFVVDSAPYYRLMTVLAFPSYREGFPNAPLEAAASALPVVGYRATGVVDAVADGQTGRLVEVGDAAGLGRNLVELLDRPELVEELGKAGRARAEAKFSRHRVQQAWAEELRARLSSDG